MDLPDTVAIVTAGSAFVGGFGGLVAPSLDGRDLLDNGQRGAFLGALIGSAGGFVLYFGLRVSGGA
jgi:hypothetical protein